MFIFRGPDSAAEERGNSVPFVEPTNQESGKVPRRAKGHIVAGQQRRNKTPADHDIIIRRERRDRSSQRGGTPIG